MVGSAPANGSVTAYGPSTTRPGTGASLTIYAWQDRLHEHFRALTKARSRTGGFPVFALEHGLDDGDWEDLAATIRAHIRHRSPSDHYWLPWIVYATELGYRFDGAEYWSTFERDTPGWRDRGSRSWLRQRFEQFHEAYGGAHPSGHWAANFSIICWPITHAILPKDLQAQLARALYQISRTLTPDHLESPESLGKEIIAQAQASWAKLRFREFAQQYALVGQIALALLTEEDDRARSLILPATLRRIVADLEAERDARQWLHDARNGTRQVSLEGLARPTAGPPRAVGQEHQPEDLREPDAAIDVEPEVALRPAGADAWDVLLRIPDFTPLTGRLPDLRAFLERARCVVGGRQRARGWLLSGPYDVALPRWPGPEETLVWFEDPPPDLEHVLRAGCRLRPGPIWVFRIAPDGFAHQIRGRAVRAGGAYVLLGEAAALTAVPTGTVVTLTCTGIAAVRLDLPEVLSPELEAALRQLGVTIVTRVAVWPAGMVAAEWDGEGRAAWLLGERPCLGVRVDHEVQALRVELDGTDGPALIAPAPGGVALIELPALSVGTHRLRVLERAGRDAGVAPLGQLEIAIRAPRPWRPEEQRRGALVVGVDPYRPTLQQLWERRVAVDIQGPAGRAVECELSLARGGAADFPVRLSPRPLPVPPNAWAMWLERDFFKHPGVADAFDAADSCLISLRVDGVGGYSFRCDRESTPLAWVARRDGHGYGLRLIDHTDAGEGVRISRYRFSAPDVPEPVPPDLIGQERPVPAEGGLYLAAADGAADAVIIPPVISSPSDAPPAPRVRPRPRSLAGLEELLSLLESWLGARIVANPFAEWERERVRNVLLVQLFGLIGGDRWWVAERRFRGDESDPAAIPALRRAVVAQPKEQGLDDDLLALSETLAPLTPSERAARFAPTLKPLSRGEAYRGWMRTRSLERREAPIEDALWPPPVPDRNRDLRRWRAEFALRLASAPQTLRLWAGGRLQEGFGFLLVTPAAARAARFLVLVAGGEGEHAWEW